MNSRPPLVSVIIPVYHVEKYLRECLDSVLGQTLHDIEVICVNDGSKDGSREILREYEARDSRLCVIDKQNEGVSIARNIGLDAARGEFVLFVDADDKMDRELCEKTYRKAVAKNLDIVVFDYSKFTEDGPYEPGTHFVSKKPFSPGMNHVDMLRFLISQNGFCWTKLSRRTLLQDHDVRFPPRVAIHEDTFFHWQVICLSKHPGYLNEALYHYRKNPDSATHQKKVFSTSIVVYERIESFLKEHGLYHDFSGLFFQSKIERCNDVLVQPYLDKNERSKAVSYVKKAVSFRDIPLLFRSDIRWKRKLLFFLMILLLKTNLIGVFWGLRKVKHVFVPIPSGRPGAPGSP